MNTKVKNILLAILAVFILVVLVRLAWMLAGFVIKLLLWLLVFAVLAGFVWYFYTQLRNRPG